MDQEQLVKKSCGNKVKFKTYWGRTLINVEDLEEIPEIDTGMKFIKGVKDVKVRPLLNYEINLPAVPDHFKSDYEFPTFYLE